MGIEDYKLKVIITAQTSQFQQGIKNAQSSVSNMTKSLQGLSKLISKVFKFAGIATGIAGVVSFGKNSVNAFQDATKSLNILNNTIRVTGASAWTTTDEIVGMSKEIAKTTNYAVGEIQDMQSVLLGFKNITGDTFKDASDAITDMATVMGMDLKSATQTVGKALDDPISGLDSLKRQGFAFTEQQKEQMKTLVENGKLLEAQKIILDELSTTYGGAAKAGQTSFARMKYSITEFKETLGEKLLPVINVVATNLTAIIDNISSKLSKFDITPIVNIITNLWDKISSVVSKIKTIVIGVVQDIREIVTSEGFQPIIEIIDTIIGIIKSLFEQVKTRILQIIQVIQVIRDKLQNSEDGGFLQKVAKVINAIIDAVWYLKEQIEKVVDNTLGLIINLLKNIWEGIKVLFKDSNSALAESETDIKSWGDYFWAIFNNVFRSVQDFIGMVSALLSGDWELAWEYAKLAVMRIADAVFDTLSTIINAFPKFVNGIVEAINSVVKEVNKVREALKLDPLDLVKPVGKVDFSKKTGLEDAIKNTEARIEELTGKPADYTIEDLKGISKASSGLTKGLLNDLLILTNAYTDNSEKRLLQTNKEGDAISGWGDDLKDLFKGISENSNKVITQVKTAFTKLGSVLVNIGKKIVSSLKTIFSGIGNFISKMFEFDPDTTLESLLAIEDNILTFFVETLPKMPKFLDSAFESVVVLIDTLMTSIDFDSLLEDLAVSLTRLLNEIPNMITKTIPAIFNAVRTIFSQFHTLLPDLKETFEDLISALLEDLPNFLKIELPKFLNDISSFIPDLIKAGSRFVQAIVSALPALIQEVINAFILLLQEPDAITELVVALIKGVVEIFTLLLKNIGPLLKALLPLITQIIWELLKALPEIIWNIIKGLSSAIWGIITEVARWVVNMLIDGLNTMLDGISKIWTWIPGTKGIPHIPHFANGTNDAPRGLALVGEYGPELVNFRGGEQVLNNHNTNKSLSEMGNKSNVFNVTFNNTQDTTAFAMMSQLKQYQRNLAFNGVL